MCVRICFSIPIPKDEVTISGSRFRTVCLCIPQVVDPLWKRLRDPGGPVEIPTDGWIINEQITAQNARDLSILATIHELAGQLSPEIHRTLEAPMSHAFKTIKLPEFATLSFDESAQQAYK